jgi:hypothetical protein
MYSQSSCDYNNLTTINRIQFFYIIKLHQNSLKLCFWKYYFTSLSQCSCLLKSIKIRVLYKEVDRIRSNEACKEIQHSVWYLLSFEQILTINVITHYLFHSLQNVVGCNKIWNEHCLFLDIFLPQFMHVDNTSSLKNYIIVSPSLICSKLDVKHLL